MSADVVFKVADGPDNPYNKRQKRRKNIFQPLVGVCEYIE
jgi:hypothetical protein